MRARTRAGRSCFPAAEDCWRDQVVNVFFHLLLPPCPVGFGPRTLGVGGHQLGLLLRSRGTPRLVGPVLPSILLELIPGKRKASQNQLPAADQLLKPGSVCGHGVAWSGKPSLVLGGVVQLCSAQSIGENIGQCCGWS